MRHAYQFYQFQILKPWDILNGSGEKNNIRFRSSVTLTRHLLGYFATRDLLGRGAKRPHVITRERIAVQRRPMRRSKDLDEMILKHPLNFPNEVRCQVKVRSKVKIGAFRLRAVGTSKYQFWAKTYFEYS